MSKPITHMDTENYMTIHHKGMTHLDPTAHLMCFVHPFKGNDELSFIVIIAYYSVLICVQVCNWFSHLQPE